MNEEIKMKYSGLALSLLLLLLFSCSDDVSGTASQAGNGFVSGIVTDSNGTVSDATVWLRSSGFLADTSGDSTEVFETFSNDTGYFSFDSVPQGDYMVEVRLNDSTLASQRFSRTNSTADLLIDTVLLQQAGSYRGSIDPSSNPDKSPMHVRVYGLNLHTRVDLFGDFIFPFLPAGEQIIHIVSGNPAIGLIAIDTIQITPGTTLEGDMLEVPGSYSRDSLVLCNIFDANGLPIPSDFSSITSLDEDGRVTTLILDNLPVTAIPPSIKHLPLSKLSITNTALSTFPPGLDRMPSLDTLDLSSNELTLLPDVVVTISGLSFLSIDNNRLPTTSPPLLPAVLAWIDTYSYNPQWRDTQRK